MVQESDEQSITATAVDRIQALGALVKQSLRRQFPLAVGLAEVSLIGCERLGERASESRTGWLGMISVAALFVVATPIAAQPSCDSGMLKFLGDIETLTVEGVGILLFIMLITAGGLKALPLKGTDRWGNTAIGGVIVGVTFFVLGPALIDLADSASPVDMNADCSTGGSNSDGGN